MKNKIIRLILAAAMLLAYIPAVALGAGESSGECGAEGSELYWELNSEGTLTISGSGDMDIYALHSNYLSPPPWGDGVVKLIVEPGVTSIGDSAFYDCRLLDSVSLPDSLTFIGRNAFTNCSSLTEITLPSGLASLGESAFDGCGSLESFNVAEGNSAFKSVDGVLFDMEGKTLLQYPVGSALTSYEIPQGVIKIAEDSFHGAKNLTAVSFPDGLETIDDSAFSYCPLLTEAVLPDSVKSLGVWAFSGCNNLSLANLGSGLVSIDAFAFSDTAITEIFLPATATDINNSAFSGCEMLKRIDVDEENPAYSSINGILFDKNASILVQYPIGRPDEVYGIPDGVKAIGSEAFYNCKTIRSVILPDSIISIGSGAFYGCSALANITIGGNVRTIGANAIPKATVIHAPAGSAAEAYANDNGNTFLELGDILGGECGTEGGNAVWTLSEDGLLTVSGSGDMASYSSETEQPWYAYRSSIREIRVEGVRTIGDKAFRRLPELISVDIGEGVEIIGAEALRNCAKLENVTLCDTVTSIGEDAFADSEALLSMMIPASVTYIATYAIPQSVIYYVYSGSYGEEFAKANNRMYAEPGHLPKGEIDGLFWQLDGEGTLNISGSGRLKSHSFYNSSPFAYSKNIKNIVIESGVTGIEKYAFYFCKYIRSIYLPDTVTSAEVGILEDSNELLSVNISPDNPAYKSVDGVWLSKDGSELILYPRASPRTEYNIPEGVATISESAFRYADNLTAVTMPDTVLTIKRRAFVGCERLTQVSFSRSLETIEDDAFNSSPLVEIDLPDSLASVGSGAFVRTEYYLDGSNWDEGMLYIGRHLVHAKDTVSGDISVQPGTLTIAAGIFGSCEELSSVTIPDSVRGIGLNAFPVSTVLYGRAGSAAETYANMFSLEFHSIDGSPFLSGLTGSKNGDIVRLSVSQTDIPEDAALFAAGYDADGKMTAMAKVYDGEAELVGADITAAKVFCWETLSSLKPLCALAETEIREKTASSVRAPRSGGKNNIMTEYISTRRWASAVRSYIYDNGNGTFSVLDANGDEVCVDTYDQSFELLSSATVESELARFGGFFSGSEYNFIVFVQPNPDEDDTLPTFRTVKYSKDWERVGECDFAGNDTTSPVDAGSLRMDEYNGFLFVRSCHEFYASPDGLNHQGNITFSIDIDKMEIVDYVDWDVSHSFNQFIKVDNGMLAVLDHGDANPRRAVFAGRYDIPVSSGYFANGSSDYYFSKNKVTLFDIPGPGGANCTGVTVGGFEVSTKNYLAAINTIDHSKATDYDSYNIYGLDIDERDVAVLISDKGNTDAGKVKQVYLTDYVDNLLLGSTPYLVKLSDDQFMVLWEEFEYIPVGYSGGKPYYETLSNGVRYVEIDQNGRLLTDVCRFDEANLSADCQPVFLNGAVTWYVNDGDGDRVFYKIGPEA